MSTNQIDTSSLGAAMDWVAKEYGGVCEVKISSFNVLASTLTNFVLPNADRVSLLISNIGTNDIIINPQNPGVVPNSGIDLGAGGGAVSMNVRDDMTQPSFGWSGIATAGATIVFVMEVVRIVKTNPVQS